MRLITILLAAFCYLQNYAQSNTTIGIGTENPETYFDINSTNSGFVPPRIHLLSVFDSVTVKNKSNSSLPIPQGTFVYNTNQDFSTIQNNYTKLIPGLYYWKDKRWRRVLTNNENLVADFNGSNTPEFNNSTCSTWQTIAPAESLPIKVNRRKIKETYFNFNTNFDNYTCEVELKLNLNHYNPKRLEIILISPSGQILELMDNQGPDAVLERVLNTTFTDNASSNLNNWTTGNYNQSYTKALGNTTVPNYENHYTSGNISNFQGFVGQNPRGKWQIIINNRADLYDLNILNLELRIKTKQNYTVDNTYKLAKQISFNSKTNNAALLNSTFGGLVFSNIFHTAITRTTTPIPENHNPNNLNDLAVKSVNSRMNTGISWLQLSNQLFDNSLQPNTTYYYQLWYKGEIQASSKQHYITINGVSQ